MSTAIQLRPADGRTPDGIRALAHEAGLHPELVRRLVALGVIDTPSPRAGTPARPGEAAPLLWREASARLARAVRLRRDLGLNYAGAILACELLDRIEELEARVRRHEPDDDSVA